MTGGRGDRAVSRRAFLGRAGAAAGGALLGGELLGAVDAHAAYARPSTPDAALKALAAGNRRYRRGRWQRRDYYSPVGERRAVEQQPFAAILACADSRVSPPLVFDVVDAVVPAIQGLDPKVRTLEASIVANARRRAQLLAESGPIIPAAIASGKLRVVAAVYEIDSGTVTIV